MPSLVVAVGTSHGSLRSVALRRLEGQFASIRPKSRANRAAAPCGPSVLVRAWLQTPASRGSSRNACVRGMPVERGSVFPTQLSATSGQEPLSGGAVLIGGEGTDQLDAGALG